MNQIINKDVIESAGTARPLIDEAWKRRTTFLNMWRETRNRAFDNNRDNRWETKQG